MDAWVDIRRKGRACHEGALSQTNGDRRAASIIAAALANDDLELRRIALNPGLLGSLDRRSRLVNIALNLDAVDESVVIAHEIGHFHLHTDPHNEVTVRPDGLGGDPVDSGAGRVEGYSPRERKEVQADVFAGELLCPSDWLRDEFVTRGRRPTEIASDLGLPTSLVINQMARALLLPPLGGTSPNTPTTVHDLDDSQKVAAAWSDGPLLVEAGPGTGKTRTLVHRIGHLIGKGAPASAILALTFSNKAAEEMRERLLAMNADAAVEMWVSTFHAFGLELILKWPSTIGRTSKVRVLDRTGSLALLEANLERLPLFHYQNLHEPAYELVQVLQAISRCKDELITPEQYRAAAEAARIAAGNEVERESAEKLQEIAAIYEIYEQALVDSDAVDFGDLVRLPIQLIQTNPDVKKHVGAFRHVLVDEYQDVNTASAALLSTICDVGTDVWVVADQRQSIYRFRGASPSNVSRFATAFGGKRHALANNYRSFAPVVRVFERFSAAMGAGAISSTWKAHRANGGSVSLTVAPTLAAEAEAIRDKINRLRDSGVPYGDQVILARSHLTLARITGVLEQMGVPLLYLGDLFERSEIRDLLSLVALDAEFGGVGLVRVAALPEYRVLQLRDMSKASPWVLLTTWLFERSDYLQPLLEQNDTAAQQRLVATYQLLKVCAEQVIMGDPSRRRFLGRIRRIEALREDTAYRAVSSEASDVEAVRVMTIHGSKGLEFRAVHLPGLAAGYMPAGWRGIRMPYPPSLPQLAMPEGDHEAEEECLFFVGLSRAQDHLALSRAEKYTTRNANPSRFLSSLSGWITSTWFPGSGKSYSSDFPLDPQSRRDTYPVRDLEVYAQCPARYRYQVIEELHGGAGPSPYLRFHRCVYVTVGWLEEARQKVETVSLTEAMAHLSEVWASEGPVRHPLERYYRTAAESMVEGMTEAIAAETSQYDRREWIIPVGGRKISITPDRVLLDSNGTVRVQRIRTGRKTKSEPDKPIYALLRKGAALNYPGRRVVVEIFYLGTRERVVVPAGNEVKLLNTYVDSMAGIERGDFHAVPDQRVCPNCQCYFMCGG